MSTCLCVQVVHKTFVIVCVCVCVCVCACAYVCESMFAVVCVWECLFVFVLSSFKIIILMSLYGCNCRIMAKQFAIVALLKTQLRMCLNSTRTITSPPAR